MNEVQRLAAIKKFIGDWNKRGSEKSDASIFWLELLTALGLDNPTQAVELERPVTVNGHKCFIDVWLERTKVLIEHKSRGIDLSKQARQSDDSFLTPFEQAKRYADELPRSKQPRWIVTCNFDEFRIYDLDRLPLTANDNRTIEPQIILFKHLATQYKRLMFLVDPNDDNIDEIRISKDAVDIMTVIRKAFAKKMLKPKKVAGDPIPLLSVEQRNMLNRFCVRLVFCLYAEDAALFNPNQFVDYIIDAADQSTALVELFNVLNIPKEQRDPNLSAELAAFPYVNGGLFAVDALDLPPFDRVTSSSISLEANDDKINWFAINPTIFGALFEYDMNNDDRRKGGMHYTSRANIHKLIKPLFLDALHDEFDAIKRKRKNKKRALELFQDKIASLTFLDPACGSGNFLTETYIKLRELENDVLRELLKLEAVCEIKVSINQFYGIEINDFACAIAQTAMWISESKMFYDTEVSIREHFEPLPLKRSARIVCANALRLDWHDIVPDGVDYIIGNPPFVGFTYQTADQKADLQSIFPKVKNLDYVACWFKKAANFMVGTQTRAAFVSTNSICQGETAARLFPTLDTHIDFAYRTFKWISESENMAAVHCVILGFSVAPNDAPKIIFDGDRKIIAENINAYLLDGPNVIVSSRNIPLCDVPPMVYGNKPADGKNLIIEADDYDVFIQQEPRAQKFIHRLIGAEEFLNGKNRWCLWLVDATADDLKMPLIAQRVEGCRQMRLSSIAKAIQKFAATPHLFAQITQPAGKNYIVVPRVSSERRKYIPMGFMTADVIASDAVQIIPDAGLFEFGVLESSLHMAWTRVVCGRLEMRYRYSKDIVYNNFPWCERTASIEKTAQGILDARSQYPEWTLAALYDPNTMPDELRAAHEANDREVLDAYGFDVGMSELEIVSRLMAMYKALAEKN